MFRNYSVKMYKKNFTLYNVYYISDSKIRFEIFDGTRYNNICFIDHSFWIMYYRKKNYAIFILLIKTFVFTNYRYLTYVDDKDWFLLLSFFLRILGSLGSTAAWVSSFSLTAVTFPETVASTIYVHNFHLNVHIRELHIDKN